MGDRDCDENSAMYCDHSHSILAEFKLKNFVICTSDEEGNRVHPPTASNDPSSPQLAAHHAHQDKAASSLSLPEESSR